MEERFRGRTGKLGRCRWTWGAGSLFAFLCPIFLVACPALLCSSLIHTYIHTLYKRSTPVLLCTLSIFLIPSWLTYWCKYIFFWVTEIVRFILRPGLTYLIVCDNVYRTIVFTPDSGSNFELIWTSSTDSVKNTWCVQSGLLKPTQTSITAKIHI